ncbi:hypothetical protein HYALB_00006036 [Hymenoscyphus albidus]|uniref:WD40 repeat-like protein n=1 Tax=Hymenoscyphus albidus TaxID=595503 RepID=A0A9N9M3Z0_9HELO|nr:hypothetical protein HYALB_00006036 [Hymenoscyphus albidus]
MLHNSLTPPYDDSATGTSFEMDHGVRVGPDPTTPSTPSPALPNTSPLVASPVSAISAGPDEMDERSLMEGLVTADSTDDDQDMSDGGADLAMAFGHPDTQLDTEMQQLGADITGPETQYPADTLNDDGPPESYQSPAQYDEEPLETIPVNATGGNNVPGTPGNSSLPAAMSEVSQQLQHLQDGLDIVEVEMAADQQAGSFANISTSTQPLPLSSSPFFSLVLAPQLAPLANLSDSTASSPSSGSSHNEIQSHHEIQTVGGEDAVGSEATTTAGSINTTPELPSTVVPLDPWLDADQNEVEDHLNLNSGDFLYHWHMDAARRPEQYNKRRGPNLNSVIHHRNSSHQSIPPVRRCDLRGEECDIQRINWTELGVLRREAKVVRSRFYHNYTNMPSRHQPFPREQGMMPFDSENYFKFRRMDFDRKVRLCHFQLRNVMACASRGHVFYAGKSKVLQWNPLSVVNAPLRPSTRVIDLSNPTVTPLASQGVDGMQVSTLATAHDVLVAGGFAGEYALVNLRAHKDTKHTEGLVVTEDSNAITNHVQVHTLRGSSLPVAAFSSNDCGFRLLDVNTNKFISEHKYDEALNCSAISPDQRLRVCVGDTTDVLITHADTGEILQRLRGHRDYGFACDWADDGWTVATGNQDMQVKIWDARNWSRPVTSIVAEMAGVRKLKFSPIGSGKKVLVAAEPADIISVIDAQTFQTKQTLNFFGETGGVDFTNDGQDLFVGICDNMRGGIMQFERCGFAGEAQHRWRNERDAQLSPRRMHRHPEEEMPRKSTGWDWISDEDDIVVHPKSRGTAVHRQRKAAELGVTIGHF